MTTTFRTWQGRNLTRRAPEVDHPDGSWEFFCEHCFACRVVEEEAVAVALAGDHACRH